MKRLIPSIHNVQYLFTGSLCLILSLFLSPIKAQDNGQKLWSNVKDGSFTYKGTRYIVPNTYRTLALDLDAMRTVLSKAPTETLGENTQAFTTISLPMPDGSWQRFAIYESSTMAPELARQFPDIKTYTGQGIDDPTASIKLDLTPQGFHAMTLSVNGSVFIDPYALGETNYYISYYKKDYQRNNKMFFEIPPIDNRQKEQIKQNKVPNSNNPTDDPQLLQSPDGKLRVYSLALAGTGEYTTFHGGATQALAAMNTTMNRVNGVYERDLSVRMTLVANNNLLVYTNANTDPYTNDNGGTMLGQNQSNVNSVIGSANYDIGHVFSTGGGGIASLGSVCVSSQKAQGVTGSPQPVGDPFDIDYVAHEMGHQFGADHTFNCEDNACGGGNRNGPTAYEPGSGSTIMAYAGICAPSDIQNNSDDYFHAGSLVEIYAFITGTGNSCDTETALANSAPVVNAGADYVIPYSTPFTLVGSATDADNDALTYCWEEMDLGSPVSLSGTLSGNSPAFRSYDPVSVPERTFPKIQTVIANTTDNKEKLPNYARTMNFRLSVRDNKAGGGCVRYDNMTVTVNGTAGPFLVTAPNNTGISVPGLSTYTVTWNVAGTTAAPVSCANVNILLSTDGGLTYPITVLANTANDGTEVVTIPNNQTTQARIRVQCANNVFFDISNNNFTITAATNPDFSIAVTPSTQSVCSPASTSYNVATTAIAGFSTPINLTLLGLPAGATSSFVPPTVTPGSPSVLNINSGSAATGNYNVIVTGTAGAITHTAAAVLNITSGTPGTMTLLTPGNAANVSTTPTFTWAAATNAATYDLQISTSPTFATTVVNQTGLTGTSYTLATPLANATTFFWRMRPVNGCATGGFTTGIVPYFNTTGSACTTYASTDVPKAISASGTVTVNSTLSIPTTSPITDLNVLNLQGIHSYMGDLRFRLISPTGTNIVLYDFNAAGCQAQANFNVNFDDDVAAGNPPCVTAGGTYRSTATALTTLDGQNPNGTWTLRVEDIANQDGGTLNSWSLQVCAAANQSTSPATTANLKLFLQGAYSAPTMTTTLKANNLLPITQPYAQAPWAYNGGEAVAAQANLPATATDWVLIEMRDADYNIVERRAAIVLSNGDIAEPGATTGGVRFYLLQNATAYYITVRHRNHLAIMSATPVTVAASTITYDFTAGTNRALGGASQMALSGSVALMKAADTNVNGVITFADYNAYIQGAPNIYTNADLNLDRAISVADFNLYQQNAGTIGIPLLRY